MTRSFRFQLALRATLVILMGLAGLSALTMLTLRAVLDRELNASILRVASIQAASLADGTTGEMHFHEWDLTPDEAASVRDLIRYAQVWEADGTSLLRSQYMTSDLPWDEGSVAAAMAGDLTWARQEFEATSVRSLFYPLGRLGEAHEAHVLQVTAPLDGRNQMLVRAGSFLALLTLLMAGATFGGSWWLAGSAIRPVHQVIDQAEAIEAGSLGRGIHAYADTLEYTRLVDVLNTMLARIRESFESQRRFTADASHELRSPLTAMRGEIELALRRRRDPDQYVEVLESNLEEVVRLSEIAENLLMLARSDAGALEPRTELTDVGEVVQRVVERLQPKAEAREIDLEVQSPALPAAQVDPRLLGQAVWNLVDNALKFARTGGHVNVVVSNGSDEIVVQVDDDGPGLGDLDPSSYFDRFFRADEARTRDQESGGTGLGLAIVKAVAEAHRGRAAAENLAGGGARFTLTFPLLASGAEA